MVLQADPSMGQRLVRRALEAWAASLEVLEVLQEDPSMGQRRERWALEALEALEASLEVQVGRQA